MSNPEERLPSFVSMKSNDEINFLKTEPLNENEKLERYEIIETISIKNDSDTKDKYGCPVTPKRPKKT